MSDGDRAWFEGDRKLAVQHYAIAATSDDPAAVAMARLRLLSFSGTVGPVWHGPTISRALVAATGPWGQLARADFHLMAPPSVGADPVIGYRLASKAAEELPGPAAARLFLATGDPTWLAAAKAQGETLDGYGDGQLSTGEQKPDHPGTWALGVGPRIGGTGAPGLAASFHHPDLAWREWILDLSAYSEIEYAWSLGGRIRTPGRLFADGQAQTVRSSAWEYDEAGQRSVWLAQSSEVSLGPGWRVGDWSASVRGGATQDGALAHDPILTGELLVEGPARECRADGAEFSARTTARALDSEAVRASQVAEAAGCRRRKKLVVATRVRAEHVHGEDVPVHLQPFAGGSDVLRGAPAGRWRGQALVASDLEVRLDGRYELSAAVFVDGACVLEELCHLGAGTGVRWRPTNGPPARMDVAWSEGNTSVVLALGEAF